MNLILIIDDREDRLNMLSLNIEMYVGSGVVSKSTYADAVEVLEVLGQQVSLVICRSVVEKNSVALDIYTYLKEHDLGTPLIVLGNEEAINDPIVEFVPDNNDIKTLVRLTAKTLGITALDMANQVVPSYFPISITHFKFLEVAPCDVFLKIKKDSDFKYKKVLFADVEISQDIMAKLYAKKVTSLYVDKSERLRLTAILTDDILTKLKLVDAKSPEVLEVTSNAMEVVKERINIEGITPEVVKISEATLHTIKDYIEDAPKLKKFLARLLNNKNSYSYNHCILISYLADYINKNIEWGSAEQSEKLGFIAFFHDIILSTDNMVRISSQDELDASDLSLKEKQKVLKHALSVSELIKNYPRSPMGADQLIRQHHGTMNGIGFTLTVPLHLSPLAVVFMIAEEYAESILKSRADEFPKQLVLDRMKDKFSKGKHRKILEVLEGIDYP